jgi:hypothetical protein
MLSVFDTRPSYSRREFLRIGTRGLGGLSLPHLLGARAVAGRSPGPTERTDSCSPVATSFAGDTVT